jgi:hypothetical protein
MQKMKLLPLAAALLALNAPLAMAAGNAQDAPAQASVNQQHNGWLGVYIRPMPHALAVQLSALMPSGEGILVDQVEPNSPAAKAGIQPNDILLSFNEQKLYSPAQLTRLVASSNAGTRVKLQVVRKGKVETVESEIGQRPGAGQFAQRPRQGFRPPLPQHHRAPMMQPQRPMPRAVPKIQSNALAWDSFESVLVNTLPDGRYHAEVSFKDANNDSKKFTFEGNKEEIVAQINKQKDLPADKREALLNALNMNPAEDLMPFNAPWMRGNPFDDPFFKNGGFDRFFQRDPFFNQPGFNHPGFNQGAPFRSPLFDRFMQPQWQQPNRPVPQNRP